MPPKKPREDPRFPLERSVKAFQENVSRAGDAAGAGYAMIGAILLLGGAGYAIDRWQDTAPWFLAGGCSPPWWSTRG
jgi:F0F1-type ATP synthase assembly protein I